MLSKAPVAAKITARAVVMRLIGVPPVAWQGRVISQCRVTYDARKALATRS